jgi:formyltetrahydrofolate-dependent phosphoribosylglycinamide formyltransferase
MNRRIAILVSGGGRSLENLSELCSAEELEAELALVISNKADAFALERAARLAIPSLVIDPERQLSPEDFSAAVFEAATSADCALVVLAGFLRFLPIPPAWERRVLNIHPSLLPAFGGKGYYGDRIHRAVLERGVRYTGCTVHYVDNVYDNGPILIQRLVEVHPEDTVDSLGARVFDEEKIALPDSIRAHFAQV